ncbi:MAG: DNA repair protein RecO [Ruminococcaceae bacterium]|nr:DNA repair protein RecO [Oscillospiraceae bacterium]
MYITTTGLVLRETEYKESSRILTVLTSTEGKLTVSARGAKRRGSKTAASTQLLAFSEMTLYKGRDNKWTLTEARSLELFDGIRDELELLSLGSYFAEVMESVSDEDSPSPEILSLGLNSLYALSRRLKSAEMVKAAFELRMMCLAGYEPILEACCVCGNSEPEKGYLDLVGGIISCAKCSGFGELMTPLRGGALQAARYIIQSEPKKIFSFTLDDDALHELGYACENYLLTQMDRGFRTLEFYKSVNI